MDLSNENVIHIKKENIEYLQFRKLLEYDDIINHAYSLGLDKNFRTAKARNHALENEQYDKAISDYKTLCMELNSDYRNLVKANQEHTNNIKIVKNKINKNGPDFNLEEYFETDGLITNKKDLILLTTNADCILLLFLDPVKKVIANVHSGWKGTVKRIAVKAVQKMKNEFCSNPKDIICSICPSIRKCHFEVDKDVKDIFENEFKSLGQKEKWLEERKNKWNIDTVFINKELLKNEGLREENIIDSGICSVCNSDIIHSYRVEKESYGLNTALIEIKNND